MHDEDQESFSKSRALTFLVFPALVQWALVSLYLAIHRSEKGASSSGQVASFVFFLAFPSLLLWLACWGIHKTRSMAVKTILFLVAVVLPLLLYGVLSFALQGFSH